jgi:two-component system, sensor histidine kinase RpfC
MAVYRIDPVFADFWNHRFFNWLLATESIVGYRSRAGIACHSLLLRDTYPQKPTHRVEIPSAKRCTSKRILVADDNRTNRNVLAAILEASGHIVVMVTDGDEALEEMKKGGIDILLIDVNMPRLNGIDTCSIWREREGGRNHLPIIGVIADATSETETKCQNAGMDMRITKPVDAQILLNAIEKYCGVEANGPLIQQALPIDPLHTVAPSFADVPSADAPIDKDQIQYLLSIGDQAFVDTMIEGFVEDVEQTLGPLRTEVADGDVSEFRFCAHAFKSSGNNMGARSLSRLCGRLEKVSEADFLEHRFIYLQEMEQEAATAVDALHSDVYFTPNGVAAQAG